MGQRKRNRTQRSQRSQTSLAVQWLTLHASTAQGTGLISGWGTKIPHAAQCGEKKKKIKKISILFMYLFAALGLCCCVGFL